MRSSIFAFLFGYEKREKSFLSSNVKKAERVFSDRVINGLGRALSGKIQKNPVSRFFTRLKGSLASTTLRTFGSLLLAFSVVTLLINFAAYYINSVTIPVISIVVSALFGIVSIPLLLFDTPICEAIRENGPFDELIHEILCVKRLSRGESFPAMPTLVAVLIGTVLGALGFLFPPEYIALAVLSVLYLLLATSSPEFSLMVTLFALPYLPLFPHTGTITALLSFVTAASFLMKVIIGKRSYHFEEYDALIFLFLLFILISGIFNQGLASFAEALGFIAIAMAYPLASNLISNKRIADNAINIILFSSIPVAIYGIIKFFALPSGSLWVDPSSGISSRADATFGNPNVYAVFLIITVVFSLTLLLDKARSRGRIFYLISFLLNTVAVFLTYTRGAWLALLLSLFGALIIRSVRTPKLLLIPLGAIPLLLYLLPSSFIERLLSAFGGGDSSISHRLSIFRSTLEMIKENPIFGIGIGEGSFTSEFLIHAEDAVSAPHSHNLFLEIAAGAGIFALFIFLFLLLVRIIHVSSYSKYTSGSSLSSAMTASAAAIFALVVFGLGDYIWYNRTMLFAFWFIFGFGSATLRISKREYDEEHSPRGAQSSPYSSSVDISVSD